MTEEQRRVAAIMLVEIKDFRSNVMNAADARNASKLSGKVIIYKRDTFQQKGEQFKTM